MSKEIMLIASDTAQSQKLRETLKEESFNVTRADSLADLGKTLKEAEIGVLVLDLDTISVENRLLRDLKKQCPDLSIIGLSSRSFHPELKEAMRKYIYACLCKPVDPDELVFWIHSIVENSVDSPNAPP